MPPLRIGVKGCACLEGSAQECPGSSKSAPRCLGALKIDTPQLILGALECPRIPKSAQESPGEPRSAQERPGSARGETRERPRSAPGAPQEHPGAPGSARGTPGSAQERPGASRNARRRQNRRPQIGSFQSGTAVVEMAGRAGPGRVATETGIRNGPPSQRAQEKNTPFGQTPHSDNTPRICG